MRKALIYGCEQMYGGLHGMETFQVADCDADCTLEDLWESVEELSFEVMETYGLCYDVYLSDFETEDDYWDELDARQKENVDGFAVWIKLDTSVDELEHMVSEIGVKAFVEKYCYED